MAQSAKLSKKCITQKGEVSSNKKKSRAGSKSRLSSSKAKPETLSFGKTSAEVSLPHCLGRPLDAPLLRLKLLDLPPRPSVDDTSQDVQNLIKNMSKFIENKRNPMYAYSEKKFLFDANKGEADRPVRQSDPKFFNCNKDCEKNKFKCYSEKSKALEKPKRISESTDVTKIRSLTPSGKRGHRELSNASPAAERAVEPQKVRKVTKGNSNSWREGELEGEPPPKIASPRGRLGSGEVAEASKKQSASKLTHSRRSGRSEIPLRKTRTDLSKHPKPLSLLMQKPLKEVESAVSIDLFSRKKPFTPIEELSLSSEAHMQSVSANVSSEKLNNPGIKSSPGAQQKAIVEVVSNGFRLDRCFKSPNIPIISNPSYSDITEQTLCSAKRSKILDLDKVRTSSFTILRSNREVLCRLESLHQQNVSTKESVFAEKVNSSKVKTLTPKPSFNLLKGKSSKKNLSTRSSSKGNKPALKVKMKKSRKDVNESLHVLQKSQKTKTKAWHSEVSSKVVKPKTCSDLEVLKDEKPAKKKVKTNRKAGESTSTSKSSLESKRKEKTMPTVYTEVSNSPEKITKLILKEDGEKIAEESGSPKSPSDNVSKTSDVQKVEEKISTETVKVTTTPPHTPEKKSEVKELTVLESNSHDDKQTDEDERSSSKTVTLGEHVDEMFSLSGGSQIQSQPIVQRSAKEEMGLTVRGTSLKIGKDEPPEKPEGSEPKKNKLHIKINLTPAEDTDYEEGNNGIQAFDWLYLNKYNEDQPPDEGGSNDLRNLKEGKVEDSCNEALHPLSTENAEEQEENETFGAAIGSFNRKTSSFLKSRSQYKIPGANLKGVRKKKIRSSAGERRLPSSNGFFKPVSLQNKLKIDTKLRSGLTKSYIREEKRDIFDDSAPIKLKRRNSEPISFRGYIWKHADSVTPRDHKASVSSMASSLKHLNTDDIDDFIFWEAVPQKMTSCWEMSLYHFKRPWSVLSCSVFEDNRQASTPGLILENLRNGGSPSPRRSVINTNERPNCPKENPFDVEPSIAQKNIDIRNWLAALNFPTPPSTSTDVISEGNFSAQTPVSSHFDLNKVQVFQKRRKVLSGLKFSEEGNEKKADEKESKLKRSSKSKANEVGDLMELIRRKSGSFVTSEQFLNSEHSIHRPNVTVNLCLCSKTPEEAKDRHISPESKTLKTAKERPLIEEVKREVLVDEGPPGKQLLVENTLVAKAPAEVKKQTSNRLKVLTALPSDLNIWKYLFLFTLFIIFAHYYFVNNSVGSS